MAKIPENVLTATQRRKKYRKHSATVTTHIVMKKVLKGAMFSRLVLNFVSQDSRHHLPIDLESKDIDEVFADFVRFAGREKREEVLREYLAGMSEAALLALLREVLNERAPKSDDELLG